MQHNAFAPPARQNNLRVALVFPNTAYVGMSNLGFHIVFQLFSALPNITCDRIFLPDKDTGAQGARSRKGHGPVKSKNQLHKYDLIAFSLSYENDYPNILTLLDQSGIPVRADERSGGYPLVIAGGITVFLNPEPLAEIFDLFIMGEAEEILPEFVKRLCSIRNAAKHSKPDAALFREIAGIYVPSGYQNTISTAGHLTGRITASGFPPIATSRKIVDINTTTAMSELLPAQTEFSGMHLVEVSRGCPRGCR
ncbi:MAG: radical SAM protein, partial [Deltaproteobacteria bacterium]|nr:radical SAM protein [Deltaproteobacteria bacterium]